MPVDGLPLLDYWITNCKNAGIDEIFINSHWHANIVEQYLARPAYAGYVKNIFEEHLLGTAGTLKKNIDIFRGEAVLIAHADNLLSINILDFIDFHTKERVKSCPISMMTFETLEPQNCGIVSLDKAGTVTAFFEKTKEFHGNLANGAVYIFEAEILEWVIQNNISDISLELIPEYVGRIAAWQNLGAHIDIGTIENLKYSQNIDIPYRKKINDNWMEWFEINVIPKIQNDMENN